MAATMRLLARGFALFAALLALAGTAAGHAVVVETLPADGAVVDRAPDQVVIRFNEPVRPITAQVLDAAGQAVTGPDALSAAGDAIRIALPPDLGQGSYIASFRVISVDSHPVGGSIVFSVGQVSDRLSAPPEVADDSGWRLAMIAVRALMHAGLLGGAGGVLFLLLVRPAEPVPAGEARRIAAALAVLGSAASILAIGIQGGLLLAGPAASLAQAGTWRIGAASPFGSTAIAAAAGLALVAAGLRPRRSALRPLAWAGAALALASFALSGHVVTAASRWITVPLLLAHATAVAYWIGSLVPLHQTVAGLDRAAAALVARFSRIAVGAVAVLVAAGLGIALIQVRSLEGLVTTDYGLVLIAKVTLVAAMIVLAALNKLRLTPALARGEPGAGAALQRTIAAEIGLAAAILVATAALGTTPPPRVVAGDAESHAEHLMGDHHAHPPGIAVTVAGGNGSAEIVLASAASGINSADIRILDGAGNPVEPLEVALVAANPDAGVEPIRRAAEETEAGAWRVGDLLLVPAGRWRLELEVLVSDFERARFETEVVLR
jgi:copper transport protein